jgi:NAD-dependent SIR2 family protein deacetylase
MKLAEMFYCFNCDYTFWTNKYKIPKREQNKNITNCPKCNKQLINK